MKEITIRHIVCSLLLFLPSFVLAPTSKAQMLEGNKFVSASVGRHLFRGDHIKSPMIATLGGGYFLSGGNYISFGLDYAGMRMTPEDVPFKSQQYLVNFSYNALLLNNVTSKYNLYARVGAAVAFESHNNGEKKLENGSELEKASNFSYGGVIDLHTDIYATELLVLTISGGGNILFDSFYSRFQPFLLAGFKFYL